MNTLIQSKHFATLTVPADFAHETFLGWIAQRQENERRQLKLAKIQLQTALGTGRELDFELAIHGLTDRTLIAAGKLWALESLRVYFADWRDFAPAVALARTLDRVQDKVFARVQDERPDSGPQARGEHSIYAEVLSLFGSINGYAEEK